MFSPGGFLNIRDLGDINFGRYAVGELTESSLLTHEEGMVEKLHILKCYSKSLIVGASREKDIINEVKMLAAVDSVFITQLQGTFQTCDELVLALVPVSGGDLWGLIYPTLSSSHPLSNSSPTTPLMSSPSSTPPASTSFLMHNANALRFYAANIILALEHMHSRDIAYRNLKPENILINSRGYLVLISLGLAKKIPFVVPGEELKFFKSFTLCGTAEYLAPEIVLCAGHDQGVDLWALGVLLYEMVMQRTPFATSSSSEKTTGGDEQGDEEGTELQHASRVMASIAAHTVKHYICPFVSSSIFMCVCFSIVG